MVSCGRYLIRYLWSVVYIIWLPCVGAFTLYTQSLIPIPKSWYTHAVVTLQSTIHLNIEPALYLPAVHVQQGVKQSIIFINMSVCDRKF